MLNDPAGFRVAAKVRYPSTLGSPRYLCGGVQYSGVTHRSGDVVRFQVISERCCSDNFRSIRGCFPMLCQTSSLGKKGQYLD
jgi:hypothetical protein